MRSFFKSFFAALLAVFVFFALALILFFVVLASATSPDKPDIGDRVVLNIDLSKHFKEQRQENPFSGLVEDAEDIPSLFDVVSLIDYARRDSSVKGMYIKCNNNDNGYASSQEIRNAIVKFKNSGKFVFAYGEYISQDAYFVANAADKVYCNPSGMLEWKGFSSTIPFFKGTLEMLKIQPQIFYAGKFKSATEPFREYEMTEANKLQTSVYLNDMYQSLLLSAASHSGKDTLTLRQLADNGTLQSSYDAVSYGLLDGVRYDDEVKTELRKKLRIEEKEKINLVNIATYAKAVDFKADGESKIALIVAEGEIVDGSSNAGQVASEDFQEMIRKARTDNSIKAIVFRVNSPGGSSLASEVILRELLLAKKVKPVVVSFGDVAASGGYYISAGADSIFAQPNTITGSIGVFALIPNMKGFFNDKLGMTFDRVKTGPYADMLSVDRPLNEGEKMFIQRSIDTIYNQFKQRVATGRKLSMEFVDSVAQGRVWTGTRALQLGLVDKLGGMQDAVDCAVRLSKVKDYRLKEYPEEKGFLESMANNFRSEVKVKAIKEEIGAEQYEMFQRLKNMRSLFMVPQARLPFDINVR